MMGEKTPDFCDFDCPHADFPPAETAGICRTMAGVWCRKLKELVNKNGPCEWKKRVASGARRLPARRAKRRRG
jgi:hypothetical protein